MSTKPHLVVKDNSKKIFETLKALTNRQVYVGIPQDTTMNRVDTLRKIAGKSSTRKIKKLGKAAVNTLLGDVSNAELLFVHSKGSPLHNIPPRPVIEPAIEAQDNKEAISNELGAAAKAALDGKLGEAETKLRRAGMAAQRASQKWFTDPRNNWPPNAPETVRRKRSSRPLIDTGAMRKAITYVVKDSK